MAFELRLQKLEYPGLLITFCGIDGCGKSTMISMLAAKLREINETVTLTRQPTDSVRQSKIFRTFMDCPDTSEYDYRSLSLLAAGDRVQHSNKFVKPRLYNGETVISDRYFYSCLANLHARGYGEDRWIYEVANFIPKPDIAFFLDVRLELAVQRVRQRAAEEKRWIDMDLHQTLRLAYLEICRANGGVLIDSSGDAWQTFKAVWQAVEDLLKRKKDDEQNGQLSGEDRRNHQEAVVF